MAAALRRSTLAVVTSRGATYAHPRFGVPQLAQIRDPVLTTSSQALATRVSYTGALHKMSSPCSTVPTSPEVKVHVPGRALSIASSMFSPHFPKVHVPGRALSMSSPGFSPLFLKSCKRYFSANPDPEKERKMWEKLQLERMYREEEVNWFLYKSWIGKLFRITVGPFERHMHLVEFCSNSNDPRYKFIANGLKLMWGSLKVVIYACAAYIASVMVELADEFRGKLTDAKTERVEIVSAIQNNNQVVVQTFNELKDYLNTKFQHIVKVGGESHLENEVVILKAYLGVPKSQLIDDLKEKVTLISELEKKITKEKADHQASVQKMGENLKAKDDMINDLESNLSQLEKNHKTYKQEMDENLKAKDDMINDLESNLSQLEKNHKTYKQEMVENLKAKDDMINKLESNASQQEKNHKAYTQEVTSKLKEHEKNARELEKQIVELKAQLETP